jgi:predicted O-linked N-acetylglucosamine transferase (SPINDLY family)
MATDVLTTAVMQAMARDLSVPDLIKTTEMLKQSGQTSSVDTLYATWIQYNQDNPLLYAVLFNYSVALTDFGKLNNARECLERAISLNPEFMQAYVNLGRVYERLGNLSLAVIQWSVALDKMTAINGAAITHKTMLLNQSARALETANQDESAEGMLQQSLEIDCRQREVIQHLIALRQRQCEWPVVVPSERVDSRALIEGMSPLSAAAFTDDPMLQLALAWHYNRTDVGTPSGARTSWPRAAATSSPLKIGYLSSDLREHAVGYLMSEVLGLHDRNEVEVYAYYCGPEAQDPLHVNFKGTADHWITINNMDDAVAARRMEEDGIQILVDLNGYTREARLKLVAMQPAPVIVNWLGFPGTIASPYHQYIIADDWIIPESHEMFYSEKVLRLPCYQPSRRTRNVSQQQPVRSEAGLPENAMIYCCFNGTHKINRFTFDRWMTILARVPASVLWLLGGTEATNARLKHYAAERGIAPERIIFADKLANSFHLARYVLADLFLDTTPYGAHTTASDALWMGVPVLTFSGRSFASRVCGSLLRSAGLAELVCTTADSFVDKAVELGQNPAQLLQYREKLRVARESCTLFNMPLLVRSLEALYRQMWNDFKNGALPRPDLANLDAYLEVGSQIAYDDIDVQIIEDYAGWWRQKLAARYQFRPIARDHRLFGDGPSAT